MLNFEKHIKLENSRVLLEPLDNCHLEYLIPVILKTPDLLKYSPTKFGTIELLEEYINNNISLKNKKLKYPFIIFDKLNKKYTGSTSFLNISPENQRIEIGSTWIGKEFQQTGLNRNCKFLLMQ